MHQQVTCMPMESSIFVVVAELVMQYIESLIFENSPCEILMWKRYVDDILMVLPVSSIEQFSNFNNAIHPNFKFTCEIETNEILPCLDILLHRTEDNTLKFSVYRKNSNSGKCLDFVSENHLS